MAQVIIQAVSEARKESTKTEAKELVNKTWGDWAWNDFNWIIVQESGWNHFAKNPNSSAYGLCQSLPPTKMASEGQDYRTNPSTQLRWCVKYIVDRYGTPSQAKNFHLKNNWF